MEDTLKLLDGRGIKVDEDGHVSDWQDRPARRGKPVVPDLGGSRSSRLRFTPEEDEVIQEWCAAAGKEGVTGRKVFEELEGVVRGDACGNKITCKT